MINTCCRQPQAMLSAFRASWCLQTAWTQAAIDRGRSAGQAQAAPSWIVPSRRCPLFNRLLNGRKIAQAWDKTVLFGNAFAQIQLCVNIACRSGVWSCWLWRTCRKYSAPPWAKTVAPRGSSSLHTSFSRRYLAPLSCKPAWFPWVKFSS